MTSPEKVFCFIDLETTGLDPEMDRILEVAWVFTNQDFAPISPERTFVIDHEDDWPQALSLFNSAAQVVQDMHTQSGLYSEMFGRNVTSLDKVWETLRDDLDEVKGLYPNATVHFAGDSVWFDREFLHAATFKEMLETRVHHRLLDLSSIKVMLEAIGRPVEIAKGTHRALDDVRASLDGARLLRNLGQRAVV